jgi:alpha-N-arabinofuranosidase
MHASMFGRGVALLPVVASPKYDSKNFTDVPYLEAVGVYNSEKGEITAFAVNRDLSRDMALSLSLKGFDGCKFFFFLYLEGYGLKDTNSFSEPDKVRPSVKTESCVDDGRGNFNIKLSKASWNVVRFTAGA